MPTKKIHFDFYQCAVSASNPDMPAMPPQQLFAEIHGQVEQEDPNRVRIWRGRAYEMRRLRATDFGFLGVIGKYRSAMLPHVGKPGGAERKIEMDDDEQLIEKTHFAFYSDFSVLITQRNYYAVNTDAFAKYLSTGGYTVALRPIIQGADLARLMRGGAMVRGFRLAIARPTNPELFQGMNHDLGNSIFASLNGTNAAVIHMTARGDGYSKDPQRRFLSQGVKRAILEVAQKLHVKKAEIDIEENGVMSPVDLVADRLSCGFDVEMVDRYPAEKQMWHALVDARALRNEEILAYFQDNDGRKLA